LPVSFRSANRRPARKRRWFTESEGFAVDNFEMDFRFEGADGPEIRKAGWSQLLDRLGELLATQELPDVDP
jgi:hypothetical protein